MKQDYLQIKIPLIPNEDVSVTTIRLIKTVMDESHLSPNGNDCRAVYAWFLERYKPLSYILNIKGDNS